MDSLSSESMPDQVAFVRHLHNVFRFDRIVSEYVGLGISPTDHLERKFGGTVDAFKPTTKRKALGYDNLKSRLERGSITIPVHAKLLAELRTLEFWVTAGGHMTIHHPGGCSDDYADALMLACWPFRLREEDSRIRVIPRTGGPVPVSGGQRRFLQSPRHVLSRLHHRFPRLSRTV